MTFRLTCPVCGKRDVYEFTFGGQERGPRPAQEGLSAEEHFRWVQFRLIPGGCETREEGASRADVREPLQEEWWYHGQGCGVWFTTTRDPMTNREVEGGGGG
ncbi:MAG: sarcosine oxidase subunit delta [Gemmatimonadota bacterium]|nr:sarcosine oxidase subunit delta [Gemmatimonadota bacterium]MDE2983540.1 sarcosine oxidase subunit delta [Gemmatimonadota bacterium]